MRIEEKRTYTIYMSVEEFDIFHPITKDIPYGYVYYESRKDEEGEYIISIEDEDMIYAIKEKLDYEAYVQEYEEYNSSKADEINSLLSAIYYELN